MRISWATDIHLDFITTPAEPAPSARNLDIFCDLLAKGEPESIFITGDISTAKFIEDHLNSLEIRLRRPLYFVLGNHDFWGSTFANVRQRVTQLSNSSEYLRYASAFPYVDLTSSTGLVGHDGWYDGFNGNAYGSNVLMNDWLRIGEYVAANAVSDGRNRNIDTILSVSRNQALIATSHVAKGIKAAITQKKFKTLVVLTHVPPFVEAHYHNTKKGEESMNPWYTSRTMGDMLIAAAQANPGVKFEVFCGHTHGKFDLKVRDNLFCHVGGSEYSRPDTQGVFEIP